MPAHGKALRRREVHVVGRDENGIEAGRRHDVRGEHHRHGRVRRGERAAFQCQSVAGRRAPSRRPFSLALLDQH